MYVPVYIQYEWLKNYKHKIRTIVDIGSSCGNVAKALLCILPNARVYAFEPIKKNCDVIRHTIRSKRLVLNNVALSNKAGEVTFYVNHYSPASSMLPLSKNAIKELSFMANTKRITVKSATLDEYFQDREVENEVFLKIDVQGAEKLVFEGGRNFLKRVSIIHVETSFQELYQGQCLFSDIYDYLTSLGFEYLGNIRESGFYPLFKLPIQENSIFVRT